MYSRVRARLCREQTAFVACLAVIVLLVGCKSGVSPTTSARLERATTGDAQSKLSNCMKLLLDSMEKPQAPFHYAFKGEENINPKYPMDKSAKPEVGPVDLQADISADEINITEVRGQKKTEHKAKKSDELGWPMAHLSLLGSLTSPGFAIAVGTTIARPAGSDTVGSVAAEKYEFDTSTATGAQKAGLEIAKSMLTNIESTKGTVWLEKDTGRLVKFNIDADLRDKAGNAWKEQYEGEVTPK